MIPPAIVVELLVRGVAIGAFLALALALTRGASGPARVSGVLFCLAAAAHTLTQWSGPERALLGLAMAPIWAFSATGAGLFWAFARDLFEDTPSDWRRFAPALVVLGAGIGGNTTCLLLPQPREHVRNEPGVAGEIQPEPRAPS